MNVIQKVFGTHSDRELKRVIPIVDKIESLRPGVSECPGRKGCPCGYGQRLPGCQGLRLDGRGS